MMEKKKKMGWTAFGLFTVLGAVLGQAKNARWQGADDPVIFTAVFCGVGGVFLVLGLVFLGLDLRRRYLLRRAYESGSRVEAEILGFVEERNMNRFSGRTPVAQASGTGVTVTGHPRVLEAAWTDANGVVHVYRSRYLYVNVEKLLKSNTVPVYIDRYNENIGFVDVDAVLPEIRVH